MTSNKKFNILNLHSAKNKYLIESELEILDGIVNVEINEKTRQCEVDFDNKIANEDNIINKVKELGFNVKQEKIEKKDSSVIKEKIYYVDGMHCASCEIVIEKRLLKEENVKSVDASAGKGEIIVEFDGHELSIEKLNHIFKQDKYTFSDEPLHKKESRAFQLNKDGQLIIDKKKIHNILVVTLFSIVIMIGFLLLNESGLASLVNVSGNSSLPVFIVFGLLAGFSSCAALVGGIVLSMSKQWLGNFGENATMEQKMKPHLLFNLGRLTSYAILGFVLGAIGNIFQFSITFTAMLVLLVSVMMIFLGLQMLGVGYFQRFQLRMPKAVTRYISDESNFNGKYMPIAMGALTFFLPCGFTITAQGLALASGSPIQGSLIMLFFAIGTLPALLMIGASSVAFTKKPHIAERFMKVAGVLVLFFALFNINSQLNVLGYKSFDDISFGGDKSINNSLAQEDGFPEIVNGVQILKMDAGATGYTPNKLKVRAGIPVRWEITDVGTSGCTNAVMSKGLFEGTIDLKPGTTSVKEFTPTKAGKYKFSCWMGMVSGTIEVVDTKNNQNNGTATEPTVIDSGAKGCGCGGGSGSCGG